MVEKVSKTAEKENRLFNLFFTTILLLNYEWRNHTFKVRIVNFHYINTRFIIHNINLLSRNELNIFINKGSIWTQYAYLKTKCIIHFYCNKIFGRIRINSDIICYFQGNIWRRAVYHFYFIGYGVWTLICIISSERAFSPFGRINLR